MALMFGTAGLPHILMRFFTVGNAKEARKSVFWATTFIGYFYILTFIIGFGAIMLRAARTPTIMSRGDITKALLGGGNMPAIHLAHAVGGDLMKGFIAAVAFATILAVVSGLTLSGASAVSHDLYASVFRHGKVDEGDGGARCRGSPRSCSASSRSSSAIVFEKVNVAFMVGLAFAVAASANFPVLLLSMLWKGLTTRGAVIGGFVGLIQRARADDRQPGIWEAVLGYPKGRRVFPYVSPALVHHAAGVLLLLVLLDHRQVGAGGQGEGRFRGPICPLADRHRRRGRGRALTATRTPSFATNQAPRSGGASFLSRSFIPRAPAPFRNSTTLPARIVATSLARRATSSTRWLTKIIGIANLSRRVSIRPRISRRRASSIAASGSSSSNARGWLSKRAPDRDPLLLAAGEPLRPARQQRRRCRAARPLRRSRRGARREPAKRAP